MRAIHCTYLTLARAIPTIMIAVVATHRPFNLQEGAGLGEAAERIQIGTIPITFREPLLPATGSLRVIWGDIFLFLLIVFQLVGFFRSNCFVGISTPVIAACKWKGSVRTGIRVVQVSRLMCSLSTHATASIARTCSPGDWWERVNACCRDGGRAPVCRYVWVRGVIILRWIAFRILSKTAERTETI